MIELRNISKIFDTKDRKIRAVDDVSLKVKKGEIYGVIGYSGAGKSTLIRSINLLEKPTSGEVIFDGVNLTLLSKKELRLKRREMGMIFQNFNLFNSRNVYDNIAFSLKNKKMTKEDEKNRVRELLELVDLSDKENSYPSELSGGQKQRVAIARALANNPKVLLCDEATSALDPKTTKSILKLLKRLNESLGLTIILITHEMAVIKEICHRVSIMSDGKIIEEGKVIDVFTNPKNLETREFLQITSGEEKIREFNRSGNNIFNINNGERLARITYIGSSTKDALISEISRKYNIDISILFGQIEILDNTPVGELIISLNGESNNIESAIDYFEKNKVRMEVIENV